MKRIITAVVALTLAFTMVSCGSGESSASGKDTSTASVAQDVKSGVTNTEEYVEAIGAEFPITDVTRMAAEMIGAEEGTSFKYMGNKFEIYKYADGASELKEASSGSLTYELDGLGEFTSSTVVNGNYMLMFSTDINKDTVVAEVFKAIKIN